MEKLINIIKEAAISGKSINVKANEKSDLVFEIHGFGKSGHVDVFENSNGNIVVEQRYGEIDIIYSYEGLVEIAYKWYLRNAEYYDLDVWEKDCIKYIFKQP